MGSVIIVLLVIIAGLLGSIVYQLGKLDVSAQSATEVQARQAAFLDALVERGKGAVVSGGKELLRQRLADRLKPKA